MTDLQQGNPRDPILRRGLPDNGHVLLQKFAAAAHGFSPDAVSRATLAVLVSLIRQRHDGAKSAADAFDRLAAEAKELLMTHYTPGPAGRRLRGIFPYPQSIAVPKIVVRK